MADKAKGWFDPEFRGTPRDFTLYTLEHYMRSFEEDPSFTAMHRPGQDWVMGYIIPPFQRPAVWDVARKVRFIESAARGRHLGTWVFNDAMSAPTELVGGKRLFHRTDRWLIDGQQRFRALEGFFKDEFPVFGLRWSEVQPTDRRRFLNQSFAGYELSLTDERELRRHYDNLNFGGVAHTEDQRALPGYEEPEVGEPAPGPR